MKLKLLDIAMLAGGVFVSTSLWASGATPAAMLSNTCNGCHGTNGVSAGPSSPTIAGQPAAYIEDAMKQFKSGERSSSIMGRLARAYSDDDYKAMAAYFSEKKFVRTRQATDAAKVAKGKQVHERNCEKCHEDNGRKPDDGGVLAGQWSEYLQISMNEFQAKKRPMPKKMAAKLEGLSKDDVDALVQFYASQQ
ncbi:MAG TPA: c-type cytochrome [Sulfuricella sp.]|nr:c-type cytochrome [Sulfuricella sp.]